MEYDNSLIRLRFIGDDLQTRSIPIYELGVSLIALQRLLHKAHLLHTERLTYSNFPKKAERRHLALQLIARKRASDGYGFDPISEEAIDITYLSQLTEITLKNIAAYSSVNDFELFRQIDDDRKLYVINAYNQVADLALRIGNIGGIQSIEISGRTPTPTPAVYITAETADLVRTVKGKLLRGPLQDLIGDVVGLYPQTFTIKIFVKAGARSVNIRCTPQAFDNVRHFQKRNPTIRTVGWPLHKMGVESLKFETFEAREIFINP
jgi:hypothetical protein